jgi:hypothetical protein
VSGRHGGHRGQLREPQSKERGHLDEALRVFLGLRKRESQEREEEAWRYLHICRIWNLLRLQPCAWLERAASTFLQARHAHHSRNLPRTSMCYPGLSSATLSGADGRSSSETDSKQAGSSQTTAF